MLGVGLACLATHSLSKAELSGRNPYSACEAEALPPQSSHIRGGKREPVGTRIPL
jgi:hypothetical protein